MYDEQDEEILIQKKKVRKSKSKNGISNIRLRAFYLDGNAEKPYFQRSSIRISNTEEK